MRTHTLLIIAFAILVSAHAASAQRRGGRRRPAAEMQDKKPADAGTPDKKPAASETQGNHNLEMVTFPEEVQKIDSNLNKQALLYCPVKKPEGKIPLIVCLHGAGGTKKKDVAGFKGNRDVKWLMTPENSKYVARILVPHCRSHWNPEQLDKAVDYLLKTYSDLDRDRIYCVGYSLGGLGTWNWAKHSHKRLAAVVPVAFIANPDKLKEMVELPIWAMAGTGDRRRVGSVKAMGEEMKKLGSKVTKITIFEGANHFATAGKAWAQEGLLEWMFAQSLKNRKK